MRRIPLKPGLKLDVLAGKSVMLSFQNRSQIFSPLHRIVPAASACNADEQRTADKTIAK